MTPTDRPTTACLPGPTKAPPASTARHEAPPPAPDFPSPALVELLLHEHRLDTVPRLSRRWSYYRNPAVDHPVPASVTGMRPARLAQEQGLPARLRSVGLGGREIVIENDIAWRLHTMVDAMFSKPPTLQSLAADPALAKRIESLLRDTLERSGGITFLQDMALLGGIYGHVDVLLQSCESPDRTDRSGGTGGTGGTGSARMGRPPFSFALIEARRGIPLLDPDDYRRLDAYLIHLVQETHDLQAPPTLLDRLRQPWRNMGSRDRTGPRRSVREVTHVYTPDTITTYERLTHPGAGAAAAPATGASGASGAGASGGGGGRQKISQVPNPLGCIPVVHIQNLSQPFVYEGLGEVEPLIPLQDELNIRLSDRANRVTFQAFKMYLGRGIEGFLDRPVGPGQMWSTDNPHGSIQEFGGDAASPSEEAHINEIREAMDKASGVNAIAAGVLRDKVGNLTSENALRIVLMGLLSKTQKKRSSYGQGLASLCELALHAADVTGVLATTPADRRIRLDWPSPMPEDFNQRLRDAQAKLAIGVPRKQVLMELGYEPD